MTALRVGDHGIRYWWMLDPTPECEVSIIVPFGDDEDSIGGRFTSIISHMRGFGIRFEILAADDDSGDNSPMILTLVARQAPELRVIPLLRESGPGASVTAGVNAARGRALVILDPSARALRGGIGAILEQLDAAMELLPALDSEPIALPGALVARRTQAWRKVAHPSRAVRLGRMLRTTWAGWPQSRWARMTDRRRTSGRP